MVGKVHLQRHHPLRPGRLRLGGRGGTDRRRARPVAAAVPPAPRCLPNATRRGGGLFAHAEACGFGHRSRHRTPISGSLKVRAWGRWVGVAPAGMECGGGAGSFDREEMRSAGGNLMPSDNNVGLNLKHPTYHVRVTTLVDQLDG